MSITASLYLPMGDDAADGKSREKTGGPQRQAAVRWVVIAETPGLLPAQIIADRLRSDGLPARAWQESIGQVYGIVTGPLGTGYVLVPAEYQAQALAVLETTADDEPED
jgi:hypothetical protein